MGLDQTLNLVIAGTENIATWSKLETQRKQLQRILPNFPLKNDYLTPDSPNDEFSLESVFDIDGNQTDLYEVLLVQNAQASYRKANQIQNYFETRFAYTNDDEYNCVTTKIDDLTLSDIVNRITEIEHSSHQQVAAENNFPTTSGFFYGDTEYDDYYFETNTQFKNDLLMLQTSRNKINKVLANTDYQAIIDYSSWW